MEKQVIADYTHGTMNVTDILIKHHIGQDKFYDILRENNVERRDRMETAYLKAARKHGWERSMFELEEAVIANYTSGKGQLASGRPFGLTMGQVKHILNKHNIPVRNQQQARVLSNQNRRVNDVNDDYFLIESPNMAWLLGFLAADGSINEVGNRIKIGLSSVDREILEKIKREIKCESKILDYVTNNGFPVSELVWTSPKHKQSLATYNIVPNKSLILQPPHKLNPKYHIDYVRGFFDGDGSINLIKNSNGRGQGNIRFQIASASKEILEWILEVLSHYDIKKPNILTDNTRQTPLHYFQFSSIMSRKIYHILYTENALKLERKYDKFTEVVQLFE